MEGAVAGADGVRSKDGVRLSILYQTSTNAVRQDYQALIKEWWSQIGVETELRNLNASVFFGGDPGSPDTFQNSMPMWKYTNLSELIPSLSVAYRCGNEPSPPTTGQVKTSTASAIQLMMRFWMNWHRHLTSISAAKSVVS